MTLASTSPWRLPVYMASITRTHLLKTVLLYFAPSLHGTAADKAPRNGVALALMTLLAQQIDFAVDF